MNMASLEARAAPCFRSFRDALVERFRRVAWRVQRADRSERDGSRVGRDPSTEQSTAVETLDLSTSLRVGSKASATRRRDSRERDLRWRYVDPGRG